MIEQGRWIGYPEFSLNHPADESADPKLVLTSVPHKKLESVWLLARRPVQSIKSIYQTNHNRRENSRKTYRWINFRVFRHYMAVIVCFRLTHGRIGNAHRHWTGRKVLFRWKKKHKQLNLIISGGGTR